MNTSLVKDFCFLVSILICCLACSRDPQDTSLSVEAYQKLGMPDPGKPWQFADYTQAYNVLAKLKWERPLVLPAKDSEKSGSLFEHMMSLDYLVFLQDSTITLNEKAARISEFMRVYDYWMDVYTTPILKDNRYHREIVDIQIFNLRLMEAMVNLAHKINESNDPADIALQFGYNSIKQNYLACLDNDLKIQSKASEFLASDLDRMADSIYASVMRNKEWMDSSAVNDLNRSLHLVMDSTSSKYILRKYRSLEQSLRGT